MHYVSGSQPVVRGPQVVPEGVPGGPQLNDGELLRVSSETKWTCYKLYFKGEFQGKTFLFQVEKNVPGVFLIQKSLNVFSGHSQHRK